MSSSNKVLKNFSYLSIVQVLNYALPLITIPIVSRALGVEKIGLVSYISSYITYFVLLVNYSFTWTAIRKQNQINDLSYTFSLVFKSQLLLLMLSLPIFFLCLFLIPDLHKNILLTCISYFAVIGVFLDKSWIYQYKQDLSIVALANAILKIISVFLIVLFINKEKDYLIYAMILYGITILTNLSLFLFGFKKYHIEFKVVTLQQIFDFLREGKMLFFSSVVISLYTSTSTLLLGLCCSERDVGLYSAATKLIEIAKVFSIMPITQLIYPIVSKKIAYNVDEGILYVQKLMPIFNLMAFFLFLGSIIVGPLAIHILFGQQFFESIPILWILSVTLVLILFSTIFGVLLMVNLGMDHLFFKNQLFVAIISVVITVLILPYGGGKTSAIILVVSEIMITAYQYYCLRTKGYNLFSWNMFSRQAIKDAFKALTQH